MEQLSVPSEFLPVAAGGAGLLGGAFLREGYHRLHTLPKQMQTEHVRGLVRASFVMNTRYHVVPPRTDGISGDYKALPARLDEQRLVRQRHLKTALDCLYSYLGILGGRRIVRDPRTRRIVTQLLHCWLLEHVATELVDEGGLKEISQFCYAVMLRRDLFAGYVGGMKLNKFTRMVAGVYMNIEHQREEVLKNAKTCAMNLRDIVALLDNVGAGSVTYLLTAGTSFRGLDGLPSLQQPELRKSLQHAPSSGLDANSHKVLNSVWSTDVGRLIAALLRTGIENLQMPASTSESLFHVIEHVEAKWTRGDFTGSGLAGFLQQQQRVWQQQRKRSSPAECLTPALASLLEIFKALQCFTYLEKVVFPKFMAISDALGDYGCCRAQLAMHPCLDTMNAKLNKLTTNLKLFNNEIRNNITLPRSCGMGIARPSPTKDMSLKAQYAYAQVVDGNGASPSYLQQLESKSGELKDRTSPTRAPELGEAINRTFRDLDAVLSSAEYRSCVGDDYIAVPPIFGAGILPSCAYQTAIAGTGADYFIDDQVALGTARSASPTMQFQHRTQSVSSESSGEPRLRHRSASPDCIQRAASDSDVMGGLSKWTWADSRGRTRWRSSESMEHFRGTEEPVIMMLSGTGRESTAFQCRARANSVAEATDEASTFASSPWQVWVDRFGRKANDGSGEENVSVRWMWGDPGLTRLISNYKFIARRNPLRWSRPQTLESACKDLTNHIGRRSANRPVRRERKDTGTL